jgi:hypothetical protein
MRCGGTYGTSLLIEVADTTLRLDRRVKIPLYARVGIDEVWTDTALPTAIVIATPRWSSGGSA